MIAIKSFSLATLLWFGLASKGLALDIDQTTNDLSLVERSDDLTGAAAVLDEREIGDLEVREPQAPKPPVYKKKKGGKFARDIDIETRQAPRPPVYKKKKGGKFARDIELRFTPVGFKGKMKGGRFARDIETRQASRPPVYKKKKGGKFARDIELRYTPVGFKGKMKSPSF